MTCGYLSESDRACGRPAVAEWEHPVLGRTPLCDRHDDRAQRLVGADAGYTEWGRIAAKEVRGGQEAVGTA